VTALLHAAGWSVNHKRVERIWRLEGLKVPQKQPKRGRLSLNDGSCIRLRPEYPGHVWAEVVKVPAAQLLENHRRGMTSSRREPMTGASSAS
jgi:transposase InsO family protein